MDPQAQLRTELRVVTQLRMRVQRQVVGKKIDLVLQQAGHALAHPAGDASVLPAPEQAVVHKNRVCAFGYCGVDQSQTGGDTGDDVAHLAAPLHLQAVGPIVFEPRRLQQFIESSTQFLAGGHP